MDARDKLSTYSDQEIEDAFSTGFSQQASFNYLESYDITSELTDEGQHQVVVGVAVMANSPTREQFEKIDEFKQVVAKFDYDMAEISFVLKETLSLNTMEFQAIYVPGKLPSVQDPAKDQESEVDAEASNGVSDLVGKAPVAEVSESSGEKEKAPADRDWIPPQES